MPGPLDGVTVLDLSEWIAGPYATKLFADAGADVIKIERPATSGPGGDPSRGVGPFHGGKPHPEKSGTFFYFNTNKRSLVLDLTQEAAQEAFLRLVDRADLVVESFRPGVLDRLGVGWDRIHARKPEIALVSLGSVRAGEPVPDYKLTDLTLFGMCGEMYSMGVQDAEPIKMYGTAALVQMRRQRRRGGHGGVDRDGDPGHRPARRSGPGRPPVHRHRPSPRRGDRATSSRDASRCAPPVPPDRSWAGSTTAPTAT